MSVDKDRWTSSSHCKHNLGVHIIFCPKYRKPYLLRFENLIRKCIMKTSIKFQFIIAEIDVMPDHVHLFIKCKTTTNSIPKIVGHLKGFSSFTIRKTYPALKKYKAFWSPSYFVESIGNMSENVIRKYIQNQKVNVKSSYKYEFMLIQKTNTYTPKSNTNTLKATNTHTPKATNTIKKICREQGITLAGIFPNQSPTQRTLSDLGLCRPTSSGGRALTGKCQL